VPLCNLKRPGWCKFPPKIRRLVVQGSQVLCDDFAGRTVCLYRLKYSYGRKGGVWCTVKNGNSDFDKTMIMRRREHDCALYRQYIRWQG
jgi:hypothetical protein